MFGCELKILLFLLKVGLQPFLLKYVDSKKILRIEQPKSYSVALRWDSDVSATEVLTLRPPGSSAAGTIPADRGGRRSWSRTGGSAAPPRAPARLADPSRGSGPQSPEHGLHELLNKTPALPGELQSFV